MKTNTGSGTQYSDNLERKATNLKEKLRARDQRIKTLESRPKKLK